MDMVVSFQKYMCHKVGTACGNRAPNRSLQNGPYILHISLWHLVLYAVSVIKRREIKMSLTLNFINMTFEDRNTSQKGPYTYCYNMLLFSNQCVVLTNPVFTLQQYWPFWLAMIILSMECVFKRMGGVLLRNHNCFWLHVACYFQVWVVFILRCTPLKYLRRGWPNYRLSVTKRGTMLVFVYKIDKNVLFQIWEVPLCHPLANWSTALPQK